jgi:F-type H+-transporting ATPase subunit a
MSEQQAAAKQKEAKTKKEKKPSKLVNFVKSNKVTFWLFIGFCLLSIALFVVDKLVVKSGHGITAIGEEVFPEDVFTVTVGGTAFPISQSVVSGWITIGIILVVAVLFRIFIVPRMKFVPGKIQYGLEWLVGTFDNMAKGNAHRVGNSLGPIIFAFASFICVGTLLEMVGVRPPNADVNTCIAMGVTSFVLINFYGFKEKGLRRFKRYFPNVLNLVSDIAVPISLTFRLFGSILSGTILTVLIYSVLSAIAPAFLSILATLMHAFIQAFIFATLTSIFIGEATE